MTATNRGELRCRTPPRALRLVLPQETGVHFTLALRMKSIAGGWYNATGKFLRAGYGILTGDGEN